MSSTWVAFAWESLLLAQRYNDMGSHFRSGSFNGAGVIVMMIALAAAGVIAWGCVRAFNAREKVRCNNPGRLFRELCSAHSVSLSERRLLKQLAVRSQLSHAGAVFVMPECFEVGEGGDPQTTRRIEALKQRIFAK